jgi:peroxiredoxin (alkyl hydroperoxide reductase subunit C)
MVEVGSVAPPFRCTAVVARRLVPLRWDEVHERQPLLLVFESMDVRRGSPGYVGALARAVRRLEARGRVAVVCGEPLDELLTWARQQRRGDGPGTADCLLIGDPDGRLARSYGLHTADGRRLWGHFLIDPEGRVRSQKVHAFPLAADPAEVVRAIQACASSARGPES